MEKVLARGKVFTELKESENFYSDTRVDCFINEDLINP